MQKHLTKPSWIAATGLSVACFIGQAAASPVQLVIKGQLENTKAFVSDDPTAANAVATINSLRGQTFSLTFDFPLGDATPDFFDFDPNSVLLESDNVAFVSAPVTYQDADFQIISEQFVGRSQPNEFTISVNGDGFLPSGLGEDLAINIDFAVPFADAFPTDAEINGVPGSGSLRLFSDFDSFSLNLTASARVFTEIDDFTSNPDVPEPSTALITLGAVSILAGRRRIVQD